MGRTAIVNSYVDEQLKTILKERKFGFGLLLAQPNADGKDFIVFAALTPNRPGDPEDSGDGAPSSTPAATSMESLETQLLVNHAVVVMRMIPGCFFVQGIFIVGEENIFQDELAVKKVQKCLNDINKVLSDTTVFRSDTTPYDNGEKLILHCPLQGPQTLKTFNINESPASFKPADWKVYDKPTPWVLFETNYDVEEIFPIVINEKVINLEQNFLISLRHLNSYLDHSTIFVQHDQFEDSMLLETLLKIKREKREHTDSFKATVFFPATMSESDPAQVVKVNGTIRYSGIVFSRIWAHPKTTLKDIKTYIRNDIVRSLAARVQIYCDSLSEPDVSNESLIISEPPRRVFIKLPGAGGIEFSEYLFRGELPEVIIEQVKEMLNIDITPDNVDAELETLPIYEDEMSSVSDESMSMRGLKPPRQEVRKNMYLAGILGAVVILIVSLILHYAVR